MSDLQDLRQVTAADVFKAGRRAARLTRNQDGGVDFGYHPDYLPDGQPIAFTLPVGPEILRRPAGAVPPYFAGLLPEGRRLTVLRRAVKTSEDDELSLLLAVGTDAPGDVQVVPAGRLPADTPALLHDAEPADLEFGRLLDSVDPHAIPGVQPKASASMISLPLTTHLGSFILKLPQPEYPHLIENEFAHLLAARDLRIPVAEAELVTDRTGTTGLLVRRFDRTAESGRLPFEDAAQVLGLPPASKYLPESADLVRALAGVTAAPAVAVRNLYLQFFFAWLTGNGDLHAKNVGVLRAAEGGWVVAPIYDIPSTLIYDDDAMAVPIAGRTRNLRARDWIAFAADIGLTERAAASARHVALRAADGVDYARLPFTGSPLHRLERELRARRHELDRF
ncbi:type II toxin-antitoxin system HipA family toxin [Nocardia asteroides]|uniref:type II toxin-antitoxin system HipA family toxin n=1 Tax=Nocardia asteroides TaxID=1824 RepID=UPI001E47F827|nr:HipA domain-containing protein [Nocardia asteroides]UGT59059.1 HipA domain-containing protein [Nocardia asteroides]